ncbi:uncharacterized protein LOC122747868 [Dromiciops gliroides]|uniref:uncharacterized protein LOC122747868 n=1 Tax=Dromiciops gliroides TaxID=33562 RepID=UPI001CC6936B|nr:uncharacterized protein LOC122747868 [Dromiciops gliroides]
MCAINLSLRRVLGKRKGGGAGLEEGGKATWKLICIHNTLPLLLAEKRTLRSFPSTNPPSLYSSGLRDKLNLPGDSRRLRPRRLARGSPSHGRRSLVEGESRGGVAGALGLAGGGGSGREWRRRSSRRRRSCPSLLPLLLLPLPLSSPPPRSPAAAAASLPCSGSPVLPYPSRPVPDDPALFPPTPGRVGVGGRGWVVCSRGSCGGGDS